MTAKNKFTKFTIEERKMSDAKEYYIRHIADGTFVAWLAVQYVYQSEL